MGNKLGNNGFIIGVLSITIICMLILFNRRKHRQINVIIKTTNEEFIVDNYRVSDDEQCVYFIYGGDERTICGNYKIIK